MAESLVGPCGRPSPHLGLKRSGPQVLAKDPSQGPGMGKPVLEFVHHLQSHLIWTLSEDILVCETRPRSKQQDLGP